MKNWIRRALKTRKFRRSQETASHLAGLPANRFGPALVPVSKKRKVNELHKHKHRPGICKFCAK